VPTNCLKASYTQEIDEPSLFAIFVDRGSEILQKQKELVDPGIFDMKD
jgi:hypothetical protein